MTFSEKMSHYFARRCDTHFEIGNVCKEEADKAEGNDPLACGAGYVEGIVLQEGHRCSEI